MPVSMRTTPGDKKSGQTPSRAPESRREPLLEAAAELFATKGYAGTSMRDIASAVDMLVGSIYYHFDSKEQILLNVYERGVDSFSAGIKTALAGTSAADPWVRLEAACVGHLAVLLEGGPFTRVGSAEFVQRVPSDVARELIEHRDRYESEFERIIADLPLKQPADRFYLKMFLLGALNSTLNWYRPGKASPTEIARGILRFVRDGVDKAD